jgi:hypothetical protein
MTFSLPTILTFVFVILKLGAFNTGVMAWSWVWVLSPLWISAILTLGFFALFLLGVGVFGSLARKATVTPRRRF